MDDSVRLLVFQQQLEKELDGSISFVGLSVTETIRACLVAGMSKKAERVRGDFKVPDKRYGPLHESFSSTVRTSTHHHFSMQILVHKVARLD